MTFDTEGDLDYLGFVTRWVDRINHVPALNYVMLVPTLRCNLACGYCQVSRVGEAARGFDWSDATLRAVLAWLDTFDTNQIKVEFQGGEPLLRLDHLSAVRDFCRAKFAKSEFVVCTNLQSLAPEAWAFFDAADTCISTSYDGTPALHQAQRTETTEATDAFLRNLRAAIDRYGPDKLSMLPTIDPARPPDPVQLIESYAALGIRSIYLRRVNHQGFARKRYPGNTAAAWIAYVRTFIAALVEHNATHDLSVEEYYLSHLLRRITQGDHHGHADLRNPNWLGRDYLVVDYDGKLYPTDEARMVSRVGLIDLAVGSVWNGVDEAKLALLNADATNYFDPDCQHCAYQPYCGLDRIDDLSRYGRIDLPRGRTEHCRVHLGLFDLAFELLYSEDPKVKLTLASWLRVPACAPQLAPRAT